MNYKIGIFGSAEDIDNSINDRVAELGKLIGEKKLTVITGATSGLPYLVSVEAYKYGATIWGFAAETDLKNLKLSMPNHDVSMYEKLIYVPKDFPFASNLQVCRKYRNVISTAQCDAGIIISGRWGTMNEFTNLYDMGKIIGVLTKTDGIADELEELLKKIHKKSKAQVIFDSSPYELLNKTMYALSKN